MSKEVANQVRKERAMPRVAPRLVSPASRTNQAEQFAQSLGDFYAQVFAPPPPPERLAHAYAPPR